MRDSEIIQALRAGKVVDLEGLRLRMSVGPDGKMRGIRTGDLYIAERNTGPHLLTAAQVVEPGEGPNGHGNWVVATTPAYPFDIWECVPVVEA